MATRNRKTKLKAAQVLLKHQPPAINPLHWKERLEQLTGLNVDTCSFCGQKALKPLGFIPQQWLPIGRSPPIQVQNITPKAKVSPLLLSCHLAEG